MVCSLCFIPLTDNVIDQIRVGVLVLMLLPGIVLVVPSLTGISVTGLMNHNIDIGLVAIASFFMYTGLLYLFFLAKEKYKVHKSKKDNLNKAKSAHR